MEKLEPIGERTGHGSCRLFDGARHHGKTISGVSIARNVPGIDKLEGIVTSVVNEHLGKYLEENPKEAQKIMKKVVLAAEAREAAAKARKAAKDRKTILNSGGLPGKLMDCTSRERDESELFLVEGQSAGGSAEGGRDRYYQAILPLRGKVLNVERARVEKVLSNEEICNLISAVGIVTADSPRDFDEFAQGRELGGATIVLDSSGGSVNDSITLGRRWRSLT